MTEFRLPDLGEGLDEAEIVAWHADVGDRVVADQPLVSVETAKALVEVPAPISGRIAERFGAPGDVIEVGAVLVRFDEGTREDAGSVVGRLPDAMPVEERPPIESSRGDGSVRAAPAVRRHARSLGVDLGEVTPSGSHGEATIGDIERAAATHDSHREIRALRGPRRTMARNMARAGREIVPATLHDEADVEHWSGDDPTLRLVRAIASASRVEPALNAWLRADAEQLEVHRRVDLGIAVDMQGALFVPVLRDVAQRDEANLRAGLERLKSDLAARSIPPREMLAATITLSNFGMLGGRHASLVVVPPQVAILGAGRIDARAVVVADAILAHRMLPLSLTFDHRAVTGAEAARFLTEVKTALES